jgi:hypothetical protein
MGNDIKFSVVLVMLLEDCLYDLNNKDSTGIEILESEHGVVLSGSIEV